MPFIELCSPSISRLSLHIKLIRSGEVVTMGYEEYRSLTDYLQETECDELYKDFANMVSLPSKSWLGIIPSYDVFKASMPIKEDCGYCGTIQDPEVICNKCWYHMHFPKM